MHPFSSAKEAESELHHVLCHQPKPSEFFQKLRETEDLQPWFSEIAMLSGIPQNPAFHPEGDVWNHTMLVINAAANRRERAEHPYGFMLSALCHDFGKIICTEEISGVVHAYRHETEGIPLIEKFLQRLGIGEELTCYVLNLTELHMKPNVTAKQHSSMKSTNHMFDRAASPEDLLLLAECDHYGRTKIPDYSETACFLRERLALYHEMMARPYLTEEDLCAMGCPPDSLPEAMAYARKLRLAGVNLDSASKQVQSFIRKKR